MYFSLYHKLRNLDMEEEKQAGSGYGFYRCFGGYGTSNVHIIFQVRVKGLKYI